jgi:hypothetical protein
MSGAKDHFDPPASVHVAQDESGHSVVLKNLHVLISQEDGVWIAQGLEIDYVAEGGSLDEVLKAFDHGIQRTIEENMRRFTSIESMLEPAPFEIWQPYLKAESGCLRLVFEDTSFHPALRFDKVEYLELKKAA